MHVSYSQLTDWNRCPYYHKLIHIDKIVAFKGNEYTAFGTAVHDTCESVMVKGIDEPETHFKTRFLEELQKLKETDPSYEFNSKLIPQLKAQGIKLAKVAVPSLKEHFGSYTIISTEEKLYEPIKEFDVKNYKFKGFIDLVIKTEDGKYHVIDWKTCSWGWDSRKKSDKMTVYQLIFYKHYFAKKHGIDPENIETHFALLKRSAPKNADDVEVHKVTSGKKRTQNAINFLNIALYNIANEKFIKNRLACKDRWGFCKFYKSEHCP